MPNSRSAAYISSLQHLIYSVLDEFLAVLFPELAQPPFAGP